MEDRGRAIEYTEAYGKVTDFALEDKKIFSGSFNVRRTVNVTYYFTHFSGRSQNCEKRLLDP
jgi:hypothetical protein